MTTLFWIGGIILALAIGFLILSWATGKAMPPLQSGYYYLRKELADRGIEIGVLPQPCVNELIVVAVKDAAENTKKTGEGFQHEFVQSLNMVVSAVVLRMSTFPSARAAFEQGLRKYDEVFDKHDVHAPAETD